MRERVTLLQTALRRYCLVAAGKRDWLKRKKRYLLWILQSKPNNRSDLIIVDAVYQCGHKNNLDSGLIEIINRTQFHVEQIPNLPMAIRVVSNTVQFEIHITQTRFCRLTTKFHALSELAS